MSFRVGMIFSLLLAAMLNATTPGTRPFTAFDEYASKDANYFTGNASEGAAFFEYQGNIQGQRTMIRPLADGRCCSKLGPVHYQKKSVVVSTTGNYDIISDQDGWDGYLLIYRNSFDPERPTHNLLLGDDDGVIGIGTSEIFGLQMETDETYIIVTAGFSTADAGTYSTIIDGPGSIRAISNSKMPSLGVLGKITLISLSLALVFFALRGRGRD